MWLVVGLGNPGNEYARTRHNVGFLVADLLADRAKAGSPKAKFGAEIREGSLQGERVIFCKPMQFMNVSGGPVGQAAGFWKVPADHVLVVYDELDLPFARLRIARGGGPGGHNGIKSLIAAIGSDFPRVRVGIGRPPGGGDSAAYVLGGWNREQQAELPVLIEEAADAVEAVLQQGVTAAMNRFNGDKNKTKPAKNPTDRGDSN
ncbi:MAG TPA: aminoacyl-tRNA hydrolase [Polyangia bacterium]